MKNRTVGEFENIAFDHSQHALGGKNREELKGDVMSPDYFEKLTGVSWYDFQKKNYEHYLCVNIPIKNCYIPAGAQRETLSQPKLDKLTANYKPNLHYNMGQVVKWKDGLRISLADGQCRTIAASNNKYKTAKVCLLPHDTKAVPVEIFVTLNTQGSSVPAVFTDSLMANSENTVWSKIKDMIDKTRHIWKFKKEGLTVFREFYENLCTPSFVLAHKKTGVTKKEFNDQISDVNSDACKKILNEVECLIELVDFFFDNLDKDNVNTLGESGGAKTILIGAAAAAYGGNQRTPFYEHYLKNKYFDKASQKQIRGVGNIKIKLRDTAPCPLSKIGDLITRTRKQGYYSGGPEQKAMWTAMFSKGLFNNSGDHEIQVYSSDFKKDKITKQGGDLVVPFKRFFSKSNKFTLKIDN